MSTPAHEELVMVPQLVLVLVQAEPELVQGGQGGAGGAGGAP
jgi:hypothetical protein